MVQPARAASLVAAVGQGCTTSCVVAALPPRAAKVGLKPPHDIVVLSAFVASSLNVIAQARLWGQGCWVLDRARLTYCQGNVWAAYRGLAEVKLPLADPSLCSASFRVHWFKQGAWKRSAQPFLWA